MNVELLELASAVLDELCEEKGFVEDTEGGVICRWKHRETSLILDAMPADPTILGFSNRWYTASLARAVERTLPSGASIRAVPPPYFLATKIEAFKDRGKGDFLGSPDFGDIIVQSRGRNRGRRGRLRLGEVLV